MTRSMSSDECRRSFAREISIGAAREDERDCEPLSFDVLLLLVDFENFERISHISGRSCAFSLIRVVLYFPFLGFLAEIGLLIKGSSRVVQIDSMCLKMWSKHAVVKCEPRASHLMSSFLLCNRDSLILVDYHPSVFGEGKRFIVIFGVNNFLGMNRKSFDMMCFSNNQSSRTFSTVYTEWRKLLYTCSTSFLDSTKYFYHYYKSLCDQNRSITEVTSFDSESMIKYAK